MAHASACDYLHFDSYQRLSYKRYRPKRPKIRDGSHLLIYNHTAKGRSPLNLAASRDGKNWDAALVLESEAGEYSYPAIIQTSDGLIHATYTWKRQKIRHIVIDPKKLDPKPLVDGAWPK